MDKLEKAKQLINNKMYQEALLLLLPLSEQDNSEEILFEMAKLYSDMGEYKESSDILEKIINTKTKNVYVYELFFKVYHGEDLQYIAKIIDFLNGQGFKNNSLFLEISKFFLKFDKNKSVFYLEKYIDNDGANADAVILLSKLYCETKNVDKAGVLLEKFDFSEKKYMLELLKVKMLAGETQKVCELADKLMPQIEDVNFFHQIVEFYINAEKFDEAVKLLLNNFTDEQKFKTYFYLSKIYEKTGDLKKAVQELIKILKIEDKSYDLFEIYSQISNLNNKNIDRLSSLDLLIEARKYGYPDIYYYSEIRILMNILISDVQEYILKNKFQDAELLAKEITQRIPFKKKMLDNMLLNETEIKDKRVILESKPRVLEITVTNKCNLKCIMCQNIKTLPWEISLKIEKELMELIPYLEQINWLGGEVFLYKNFNKLFETACLNYVKQIISTNALLLTDDILKKIMQYNVELSISIDGVEKNIYEQIRCGAKFEDLVDKLKLINKLKKIYNPQMKKRLCAVVMGCNYEYIDRIVPFAAEYEFTDVTITPVVDYLTDDFVFYDKYDLDDKIGKITEQAKKYNISLENCLPGHEQYLNMLKEKYGDNYIERIKNKTKINTQKINKIYSCDNSEMIIDKDLKTEKADCISCFSPWQKLFIDCMGYTKVNCNCGANLIVGNIADDMILSVWNNENMMNLRHNLLVNEIYAKCSDNCRSNVLPREKLRYTY